MNEELRHQLRENMIWKVQCRRNPSLLQKRPHIANRMEEAKRALLHKGRWIPPVVLFVAEPLEEPRDIQFRVRSKLRSRFNSAVRYKVKTGSAIRDLGCTIEEFIDYIATLFQPGMSWDNHGEWHLDHIDPLATFDLTDPEQVSDACHYTNIRPLWAAENLARPKPSRFRAKTP